MTWKSIALRSFLALVFAFWAVNVLAVAVFAVGDRYSGIELIFMSLVVLLGGFAPVAFLVYLFRDRLSPSPRSSAENDVRVHRPTVRRQQPAPVLGAPVESLSERELEVLALIAQGLSNKEIAARLSVTVGTVKTHTNNINRKLGSRTRTQALASAREHGLL